MHSEISVRFMKCDELKTVTICVKTLNELGDKVQGQCQR